MAVSRIKNLISGLPWFATREDQKVFDSLGLSCVYVVGPVEAKQPLNIGWTSVPLKRFKHLQIGNHAAIRCFDIAWVAGPPLAKHLQETAHEIVGRNAPRLQGDWFDATIHEVGPIFQTAITQSGIAVMSHDELRAQIHTENERRISNLVSQARRARLIAA